MVKLSEHRSKSRVWLLVAAAVVILVAVGFLAYPALVSRPVATVQLTGAPICDPGSVRVSPTAESGVALFVTAPGPNFVQIDVRDAFNHRRLFQQVTAKSSGAEFAMWGDHMFSYRQIDVKLRNGGTCTVGDSVLSELNRAHGWK